MLLMGKMIQQLRKQQGLTQEALGAGIVSKSVISRVENGQYEPDIFTLYALMKRLGKSLKYFEIIVSNKEYELLEKGAYDTSLQTTVVAESEFFKDMREAHGLSQEQFSFDIYARETISNIENGRAPRRKKARVLFEKLGESYKKYYAYVVSQEYEIFELVETYQQKRKENVEEARKIRLELKKRMDGNHPVNRQFMESAELMEKRQKGSLTAGETMAGLEKCLRYTMPEYDGTIYRIPHRQETVILKEIVECLKELNRKEATLELAFEVEKKNSKKLKISQNVTAFSNKM